MVYEMSKFPVVTEAEKELLTYSVENENNYLAFTPLLTLTDRTVSIDVK